MGITDWFRRRDTPIEPEALIRTLVDASERKDYPELMRLINTHGAAIRECFRSWMTVPEDVRGDREAVQRYVNTLLMLATVFENAGDPALKNWLMRRGEDNPLEGWQRDLERGQALIDEGRPASAIPLLRGILDSMRGVTGTGIDHFRPRVLGQLGVALARSGNRAEAISVTREARELCRNIGDEEGVRIFTANLDALGTFEIPSGGRPVERFVLAFLGEDGRTLAPDELPRTEGTVKWEIRDIGRIDRSNKPNALATSCSRWLTTKRRH